MTTITAITFAKVVRPMRTLFATSLGAKTAATSVLVRVALADGSTGLGEAPTSFVLPHETVPAIGRILREARRDFVGTDISRYLANLKEFRRRFERFHMTLAGLEVALFRAELAALGVEEHRYWGGQTRAIETDITIPFLTDAAALSAWLDKAIRAGFTTYKIKVAGNPDEDLALVRRVRQTLSAARDRFTLRLDGNQGYTAPRFLRLVDRLAREKIDVELFEQPLRRDDVRGLASLRGRCPAPVILDETVFCAADCRRVIEQGLGEGVNIKIAKSGIAESTAILKLAKKARLKLMIGCMTETMVGLSAGINLAGGTGAFDYIDLDSIHLLHHGRRYGNIRLEGPRYLLAHEPRRI